MKGDVSIAESNVYAPNALWSNFTIAKQITGLENANATGAASFIAPANLGCYMTAVNKEVLFVNRSIPDSYGDVNGNNLFTAGIVGGVHTGFGDLETNIIILENTQLTRFTIRCWQTLEYTPVNTSITYKMAHSSPELDEQALLLYRQMVQELPVAVTYYENASFWKKLMGILGKVGGTLSTLLPGPYGMLAGGLGGLTNTIGDMIE